ncbi:MAG TPA: hypothetical protein PK566_14160 [Pseudobacteroides sp.]|nr:hypothetical protein [Pseudobacteroides sp.]
MSVIQDWGQLNLTIHALTLAIIKLIVFIISRVLFVRFMPITNMLMNGKNLMEQKAIYR